MLVVAFKISVIVMTDITAMFIIRHRSPPSIDYKINYSQLVKDLGVTFDPKLNFNHHIYEITHKATKIFGILKRTFLFLNKKTFLLYKSLIGVVVRMRFWIQRSRVRTSASICFLLEQETLSALLQSTQL